MSSIVCSLSVTPDGRRDSRQVVGCGKEVLKDLSKSCTGRCVSREAASAVPALCGCVVHPCGNVFQWCYAWGEQVLVGDVRCELEVVDGEEPRWVFISENVARMAVLNVSRHTCQSPAGS